MASVHVNHSEGGVAIVYPQHRKHRAQSNSSYFFLLTLTFPAFPDTPPPPPPNTHTQVPIIFFETCHGYRVQNHLIFPFKMVQFLSLSIQDVFHVLL